MLKVNERRKLIAAIEKEARKLRKYQDGVRDDNEMRQACIDNDLGVIHQRLRELNVATRVDSMYLNDAKGQTK